MCLIKSAVASVHMYKSFFALHNDWKCHCLPLFKLIKLEYIRELIWCCFSVYLFILIIGCFLFSILWHKYSSELILIYSLPWYVALKSARTWLFLTCYLIRNNRLCNMLNLIVGIFDLTKMFAEFNRDWVKNWLLWLVLKSHIIRYSSMCEWITIITYTNVWCYLFLICHF